MEINTVGEALQRYGTSLLTDSQLLEVLGIPTNAARQLMAKGNQSLTEIAKLTIREITEVKGIGTAKAAQIIAAIEIGRRRASERATQKNSITSSLDIYERVHPFMRDLTQEEFWIILMNRRSQEIAILPIHKGGMSAVVVDPKIVFQNALIYKASCLVLIHNHPSGSPSPSVEDIRLTEKIKAAGGYLDIKVLDHVVIGDGSYYSFADEGKI